MDDLTKLPAAPTLPDYSKLEIHPLAELLPEASSEDYKTLKESIRLRGVLEQMWVFEGRLLDGRHRYRAVTELGRIQPKDFQHFKGTPEQAKAFVFDKNLARRQLTHDDKEKIARQMIKDNPNDSNRAIAKRCGLSHVTIAKLKKEGEPSDDAVDKDYDKFAKAWKDLNDGQQERFVEQFKADLRELLLEV